MFITISCPHCEKPLEVDVADVGATAPCPGCGGNILIPNGGVGPGTTLGNFFISSILGQGGMGCVYLATQLSMDRHVALKVLSEKMTQDKVAVERFIHEVRVAARLEHPNVVTAFEAGEDSGYYYLAMSYVQGKNLQEILWDKACLPEVQALYYAGQVAEALRYAWDEYRVLHRDIKPANIMVDRRGNAKLMDLGISKSLSDASTSLTLEGTLLGTPRYMSPEQCEGRLEMDFRADIYSLGATLFHLVVGRQPFLGETTVQLVTQHLHSPVPSVHEVNPSLSTGLARLIRKMMAKKVEDRHTSWDALVTALDQARERAETAAQHAKDDKSGKSSPAQRLTLRSLGQPETKAPRGKESLMEQASTTPREPASETAGSDTAETGGQEGDTDPATTPGTPPPRIDLRRNRIRWLIRRTLKMSALAAVLVCALWVLAKHLPLDRPDIIGEQPLVPEPVPRPAMDQPTPSPKIAPVGSGEREEVVGVAKVPLEVKRVRLMRDLHAAVAEKLMAGDTNAAILLIDEARERQELAKDREALLEETNIIRQLGQALTPALATFAKDVGKTVTVSFTDRKRTIFVQRIDADQVVAEESGDGGGPIEFGLSTLTAAELARRLREEMARPTVALAVGLRLAAEGRKEAASTAFDRLPHPLCTALRQRLAQTTPTTPEPEE
ncbi:MAG: serine/threonine protein kinase [Lentisphaeria bacterium]|nr:serine/threonine protein kinase [Lentisphaeria bacterium]